MLLERFNANAPHEIDKTLCVGFAMREIKLDQLLDDIGHFGLRHLRPQHFAERGIVTL